MFFIIIILRKWTLPIDGNLYILFSKINNVILSKILHIFICQSISYMTLQQKKTLLSDKFQLIKVSGSNLSCIH